MQISFLKKEKFQEGTEMAATCFIYLFNYEFVMKPSNFAKNILWYLYIYIFIILIYIQNVLVSIIKYENNSYLKLK